ncbi:hypothetical protein ACFL1B_06300 [Nanoarchaeota archaeon]
MRTLIQVFFPSDRLYATFFTYLLTCMFSVFISAVALPRASQYLWLPLAALIPIYRYWQSISAHWPRLSKELVRFSDVRVLLKDFTIFLVAVFVVVSLLTVVLPTSQVNLVFEDAVDSAKAQDVAAHWAKPAYFLQNNAVVIGKVSALSLFLGTGGSILSGFSAVNSAVFAGLLFRTNMLAGGALPALLSYFGFVVSVLIHHILELGGFLLVGLAFSLLLDGVLHGKLTKKLLINCGIVALIGVLAVILGAFAESILARVLLRFALSLPGIVGAVPADLFQLEWY